MRDGWTAMFGIVVLVAGSVPMIAGDIVNCGQLFNIVCPGCTEWDHGCSCRLHQHDSGGYFDPLECGCYRDTPPTGTITDKQVCYSDNFAVNYNPFYPTTVEGPLRFCSTWYYCKAITVPPYSECGVPNAAA